MLWDRSPLATAPITRAASLVGCTRLATSEFTFVTESAQAPDRKSTRLNSSHLVISYAVFCLKKKKYKLESRGMLMTQSPLSARVVEKRSMLFGCFIIFELRQTCTSDSNVVVPALCDSCYTVS